MNRKEQQITVYKFHYITTESLIQIICKVSGSRGQLRRTRHHQGVPELHDLLSTMVTWKRAGHTRSLVIDRERHQDLQKYRYKEIMKQRAMIQRSPGCNNLDRSVFQGSRSLEMVDGPRGLWSIRREPE